MVAAYPRGRSGRSELLPGQQSITASEDSRPPDEWILLCSGSTPFPRRAAQKETWESMIQIPVSIARTQCLFQGHTDGPRPAQVKPDPPTVGHLLSIAGCPGGQELWRGVEAHSGGNSVSYPSAETGLSRTQMLLA